MAYYRYSGLQKGALITAAVVLCAFQILLWGIFSSIAIQTLLRNPSILLGIPFWAIVVGGGYGLTTLGLMVFWIERYAAFGIPLHVRIGIIAGAMLSIYLLIDSVFSVLDLRNHLMALFVPLGPLTLLLICFFLITRLRKKISVT
ncbi:MAG: hypothetical protein K2Y13_01125 [Burkholderiaceae bacterium]|uniref:Uncharacterized protein n=1 Tax=Herminiimonas contaminans TaxID=1111140 RepID=A0ABS0EZ25_9BURK|nr:MULTISPECIES: hypothetical protein [Oxalobacteraceae]MBF8179203.1 hypothetical protein [Herminiimonas contaminans]MBX9798036.1 hypothetical protein [Burkholderiaceae bacterium]